MRCDRRSFNRVAWGDSGRLRRCVARIGGGGAVRQRIVLGAGMRWRLRQSRT
jgi:hypothetical protein